MLGQLESHLAKNKVGFLSHTKKSEIKYKNEAIKNSRRKILENVFVISEIIKSKW